MLRLSPTSPKLRMILAALMIPAILDTEKMSALQLIVGFPLLPGKQQFFSGLHFNFFLFLRITNLVQQHEQHLGNFTKTFA